MARQTICPYCLSTDLRRVRFTWWGGALGPWIFRYNRCRSCKRKFFTRLGKRRWVWIVVYNVVFWAAVGGILAGVLLLTLPRLLAGAGPNR